MTSKTFYKWVLTKKNELTREEEIVNYGIVDTSIEIDVEKIFPNLNYCGDRDLCNMQKFADKFPRLKEHHYSFKYKQIEIDFSDLQEKVRKRRKKL